MVGLSTQEAKGCKENAEVLMLERLCKRFVVELLHEGIISENDAEVYYYGLFQLAMLFLNVGTTAVLAIAFHAVIPCIMLNLSYIPLRISAGGHHASTPRRCRYS